MDIAQVLATMTTSHNLETSFSVLPTMCLLILKTALVMALMVAPTVHLKTLLMIITLMTTPVTTQMIAPMVHLKIRTITQVMALVRTLMMAPMVPL